MDDLISRQAEMDALNKRARETFTLAPKYEYYVGALLDIGDDIKQMPTIEEHKTGQWEITEAYPHNVYCSECHKKFAQTHWTVWEDGSLPRNYCPNCGAYMRGEEHEQKH